METGSDYGLSAEDRVALASHLDDYWTDAESPELDAQSLGPAHKSATVINLAKARQLLDAARTYEAAAPDAPERTAEILLRLAETFRERARSGAR